MAKMESLVDIPGREREILEPSKKRKAGSG